MEADGATMGDAQSLQQLTLAHEHVMICLCGVDVEQDVEARVLGEALQKLLRIKLQMDTQHQLSLARAHGGQITVAQTFTNDVDALVAAVPSVLRPTGHEDPVDLDALLGQAGRYFTSHDKTEHPAASSFRLVLVYRQVKRSPQLRGDQVELSQAFLDNPVFHLDVLYWHHDVPLEAAQSAFDQLCAYDSGNAFAKFYFLEVGGSLERLHQVLVLLLAHQAHRPSQQAAEQLLGSWFSPSKAIGSLEQQHDCNLTIK